MQKGILEGHLRKTFKEGDLRKVSKKSCLIFS